MQRRPTVILLHPVDAQIHESARETLSKVAVVKEVESKTRNLNKVAMKEVQQSDGVLVRLCLITSEIIEGAQNLKIIGVHGTGVDNVDLEAANRKGIVVTNAPLSNTTSVAEYTFGLILSLTRKTHIISSLVKSGKWSEARSIEPGFELSGKTLGTIGLGNVGSEVAEKARAFKMRVMTYDPYIPKEKAEKLGVTIVDLETLLRESDVITVHVPLVPATRHMLSAKQFCVMKKNAILVNTARGAVIDEAALYQALKAGQITGAALDVTEKEPPDSDAPLFTLDNVIITPHVAGSSKESMVRMAATPAEDIARFFSGQSPIFQVKPDLYTSK